MMTQRTHRLRTAAHPVCWWCNRPIHPLDDTCSRHLCAQCATVAGPDTHLCPTHAAQGVAVQTSMEF